MAVLKISPRESQDPETPLHMDLAFPFLSDSATGIWILTEAVQ